MLASAPAFLSPGAPPSTAPVTPNVNSIASSVAFAEPVVAKDGAAALVGTAGLVAAALSAGAKSRKRQQATRASKVDMRQVPVLVTAELAEVAELQAQLAELQAELATMPVTPNADIVSSVASAEPVVANKDGTAALVGTADSVAALSGSAMSRKKQHARRAAKVHMRQTRVQVTLAEPRNWRRTLCRDAVQAELAELQ